MISYDLLIIYEDGDEKTVFDVNDYRFVAESRMFEYIKNGHRSFVPVEKVRFFGRQFDYKEEKS